MVYEVYVCDTPYHLDRPFDYAPPISGECVTVGAFVKVPFGRTDRTLLGAVVGEKETSDSPRLKPIHSVMKVDPLSEEEIGLCSFIKNYNLCTFFEAVRCILPPGALSDSQNIKYRRTFSLTVSKEEAEALLAAPGKAGVRSDGQRAVLTYLKDIGDADESLVRALPGVTSAHVRALLEKGILAAASEEEIRNPYAKYAVGAARTPIALSPAQKTAKDAAKTLLDTKLAKAALLYGVTGSGKTQVILSLIDEVVDAGRGVIMLVPEISLTPQTVRIFCSRYGARVAVLHSGLSEGERQDAYRRIKRGDVDVVVGTRSAVFAPIPNLGMIVIDEEHEHTYKSESDPKYHARDVAAYRVGRAGALMLLASATPSIESFYKAECGVYTLIPLRERYGGASLPTAVIVDMREELRQGNTSPVSERLYRELLAVKEREKQAILFLNRRGYNSQISCKSCGEVITCPRCSVSLTYHTGRGGGRMLCHLCGYTEPPPKVCPACSSDNLSYLGFGTQKVEGELGRLLSDMKEMRMDADTTGGKLAYDTMLEEFRAGHADILLGTQMVTKGHDFPRVTLVGVVLADTSLHVSDFRASERTFSLLTQVIGRAGRAGDGGIAVIQTYTPNNEVIGLACKQDYDAFYRGEIAIRRELTYPPFCDMVQLTLTSEDEGALFRESGELTALLKGKLENEFRDIPFTVFGPFEAQVYKLNEKYRLRLVLKCKLNNTTRRLFHDLLTVYATKRDVTLAVELNPLTV